MLKIQNKNVSSPAQDAQSDAAVRGDEVARPGVQVGRPNPQTGDGPLAARPADDNIRGTDNPKPTLVEPGSSTDETNETSEEEELGFIRSGLKWLRENVTSKWYVRVAVAAASFLIPGLGWLAWLMLALDAIMLLDKVIAGEKITLKDIFPLAAGLFGAATGSDWVAPAAHLVMAGMQLWEQWRSQREEDEARQLAEAPLRSREELSRLSDDAHTLATRIESGSATSEGSELVRNLLAEADRVQARLDALADDTPEETRRDLDERKQTILGALGEIHQAQQKRPSEALSTVFPGEPALA